MSRYLLFVVVLLSALDSIGCVELHPNITRLDRMSGKPQDSNLSQALDLKRIKRQTMGVNSPVTFDVNRFLDQMDRWIKELDMSERRGFVKGLAEQASFQTQGTGLKVMVFNLNLEYASGLIGVKAHKQYSKFGATYGLWVFECGWFENKGPRGFETWAFTGYEPSFTYGKRKAFTHPKCEDPNYRPPHHVVLTDRAYEAKTVEQFSYVNTLDDCASKTIELGQNMADYEHSTRKCNIKPTHYEKGWSFDKKGLRMGDYAAYGDDVEETKDPGKRDEWIKSGKCDLIHDSSWGTSYCKVYPHRPGFSLFIRHRF